MKKVPGTFVCRSCAAGYDLSLDESTQSILPLQRKSERFEIMREGYALMVCFR